jgi:hypothetical protein
MLIGLLTLAFLLFGRGHETFLLNPELSKSVNIYVKDKERKKEIDSVIKVTGKTQEAFEKKEKSVYEKKLVSLNMSNSSTPADFQSEYDLFYKDLDVLSTGFVNHEMEIRGYIHPAEWDSIMNRLLKMPDNTKAQKSLSEENKKIHDRLLSITNKYITNPSARTTAAGLLDGYEKKSDSLGAAFLDLNYRYLQKIRPYNTPRADFIQIRNQMANERKSYSGYLVSMRFKLLAITPEKNWESLAKELNQVFTDVVPGSSK